MPQPSTRLDARSSADLAPHTVMRANFVAPSASRAICSANDSQTSVSASVNTPTLRSSPIATPE